MLAFRERIISLLNVIYPALKEIDHDYCLIGSGALLLSGIHIVVHDVDILTNTQQAQKLKAAWKGFLLPRYSPENPEIFRSTFGRFDFGTMPVEVMGDLDVNRSGVWERITVATPKVMKIGDYDIRVPSLQDQLRIFRQLGREKDLQKAEMIEAFLKTRT